jgi:hypothetical protein
VLCQRKGGWSLALAVNCFGIPSLYALDYNYSLYSSAEYTNNIRQAMQETGETVSGNILRGGLGFNLNTEANARLAADVAGNFAKVYYSASDLDAEDHKALDVSFLFQPRSNNFRLALLESLQQVAADRRSVRTVNNLRDVNILSVVPSYFIDLTPVSRIRAAYGYSAIDEEFDDSSRDVTSATVGYQYSVSNLSDWSLNISRSTTKFTDTGQAFDQETVFLRWTYTGVLTNWNLDVGQQRIVEGGNESETLVTFSIARQVNNFSNVGLFYHQGYGDVVNTSVTNRLIQLVPNSDVVFADELAREKQVTLFYELDRGTLGGRLGLEARRLKSEESVAIGGVVDEDRYALNLGMDYRFHDQSNGLSPYGVGAWYRYADEQFNLENENNRIHEAAIRFDYFATRSTRFYVELRSRDTAGTGPAAGTDEHLAVVGFRFAPRGGE